MSFSQKLILINDLVKSIAQYGDLPKNVLNKINYKFRLDWNYYSNSIEGNSLTMQETRSIMIGNITVNGKPVKDIIEMKGHDDIVNEILKIGKSELNLSENRIKNIHRGIMHEDDPEKQPWIGKWKNAPNYLYNYRGERFDFVAPPDVDTEMHQLINWLNKEKEKIQRGDSTAIHPVEMAFQFHLNYIAIHPFYDGNGRTARIFTNLILISYGYPPVYVKNTEKDNYYKFLGEIQSYGANPNLFYDYMSDLLIRSLNITIDAIEGKEIEEEGDVDKELYLLKNAIKNKTDPIPNTPSRPQLDDILIKYLGKLIVTFHEKLNIVREIFNKYEEAVLMPHNKNSTSGSKMPLIRIIEAYKVNTAKRSDIKLLLTLNDHVVNEDFQILAYYYGIENVNEDASARIIIPIKFKKYNHIYYDTNNEELFNKNYDEVLTDDEINVIVTIHIKKIINDIKLLTNIK